MKCFFFSVTGDYLNSVRHIKYSRYQIWKGCIRRVRVVRLSARLAPNRQQLTKRGEQSRPNKKLKTELQSAVQWQNIDTAASLPHALLTVTYKPTNQRTSQRARASVKSSSDRNR
jgi:hypothetical protein